MKYQFPAIREGIRPRSMRGQTQKIMEELGEVQLELLIPDPDLAAAAFEAANVLHAAETLLRMLEAEGVDVDAAILETVEKNRERGYYGADV